MTRGQPVALCPMLEQEVAGYNLLLQTLVVLSRGMDVESGEPVEGGAGWPFAQVVFAARYPSKLLQPTRMVMWLQRASFPCEFVRDDEETKK